MILTGSQINEMDKIEEWAKEAEETGSKFPGMSYEDGVIAALDYIRGFISAGIVMGEEE
jgi:hypothetical protein